jgi:hypothetical protein
MNFSGKHIQNTHFFIKAYSKNMNFSGKHVQNISFFIKISVADLCHFFVAPGYESGGKNFDAARAPAPASIPYKISKARTFFKNVGWFVYSKLL